ncbi:MAG TPA: ABC transporter substrate-binding protein [Acidimicrobiia bacterium]
MRSIALALALCLVTAACGRGSSTTAAPPSSPAASSGTGAGSTPGLDQGAFGNLGVLCHAAPANSGPYTATDLGVTANAIDVTTFSDPGYSGAKGLNEELFDTATAFTNWCNAHGGINGRHIDVTLSDGKLLEAEQRMVEACDDKTFMAVGGGNVFDDTMQSDRLGCKNGAIPQVAGYLVTAKAVGSDLTIVPSPAPLQDQSVGMLRWLTQHFPSTTDHIGIMTGEISTTEVVAQRTQEALGDIGAKVIYNGLYPPTGTDNWRPYVSAMQAKGVRGLYWVGQPAGLAQMLDAAKGLGLKLDWVAAESNHYDPVLFQNASPLSAVNGVYVNSSQAPFLPGAASKNTATQDYLDMMQRWGGSSKKIASLGDLALSGWLLWAKAAGECGADLTRDCVWAKLKAVHSWTGGGLMAVSDPGNDKGSPCFTLFETQNGKFTQPDINANTGIYNCSADNVVVLKRNYGTGARCPNPVYRSDPKPSTCGPAKG